MQMALNMKENLKIIQQLIKELSFIQMEIDIQVNFQMESHMEKEKKYLQMKKAIMMVIINLL